MKLLLTGFNGFVAGSVIAQARGKWEIHGIGRAGNPVPEPGTFYHTMDLLDNLQLTTIFNEIHPVLLAD